MIAQLRVAIADLRARSSGPRALVLAGVLALALVAVPVIVDAARSSSFTSDVALVPAGGRAQHTNAANLRMLLADPGVNLLIDNAAGQASFPPSSRRLTVVDARVSGVDGFVLRAAATTRARATRLAHVAAAELVAATHVQAQQSITAELRVLLHTRPATPAGAAAQRRLIARLQAARPAAPAKVRVAGSPSSPSSRPLDRLVGHLPGGEAPRPSPVIAGVVGLAVAVLLWLLVLTLLSRAPSAGRTRFSRAARDG